MRSPKKDTDATIIGKSIKIDAKLLSGTGIVKIEGNYHGEIHIDGELILAKAGHISGNINVVSAYISGSITGNIKCSDLLHIQATGKISGDIECNSILMDEGAVFTGYSKMVDRNPDPLGLEE